jgi:hypothetical protein
MRKLTKTGGIYDTLEEARERFHVMVSTREDKRAETDALFENAKASRARDRAVVNKHFVQAPAAVTMATNLQAEMPKEASVAPHFDAWLEKNAGAFMSDAQKRYPELLKVSGLEQGKLPQALSKGKAGGAKPTPVQSSLSGGSY